MRPRVQVTSIALRSSGGTICPALVLERDVHPAPEQHEELQARAVLSRVAGNIVPAIVTMFTLDGWVRGLLGPFTHLPWNLWDKCVCRTPAGLCPGTFLCSESAHET